MKWLKDSILDVLFLGVIISTLFYPSNTSFIIIWVYTGLLLLSKVFALFMPQLQKRASKTSTPNWVYHLIYAVSSGALLYAQKWYLAALWMIIWILSIILLSKQTKSSES
jgi:phosphatidylglycerophosphate synthase